MIKIYFDGKLIDESSYSFLSNTNKIFDDGDSFKLGSVTSNSYKINIDNEAFSSIPNIVQIYEDDVLRSNLIVDNFMQLNELVTQFELVDKMVELEGKYDGSELINNRENVTVKDVLLDICNKFDIQLGTTDFLNSENIVTTYNNTISARTYVSYIAELNGGFAYIGADGKLYLKKFTNESKGEISILDVDNFKIGEKHVITRVVYELGALKYEFGDKTGDTVYLCGSNPFINDEATVKNIYDSINGFTYYCYKCDRTPILSNVFLGDTLTFSDGTNKYQTIAQFDVEYMNGFYGKYFLNVQSSKQQEIQIIDDVERIRQFSIDLDRVNQKLTTTAKEVDEHTETIAQQIIKIGEIESTVSKIDNPTRTIDAKNSLIVEDAYNFKELKIHGAISLLYPSEDLYPSDDLYLLDTNLIIEDEEGIEQSVHLPFDYLNYIDENAYDEFVVNKDEVKIIRRVEELADGTLQPLEKEKIETLEKFLIPLYDGYNKIYLESFDNVDYELTYLVKNDYTDAFATKIELATSVKQTEEKISLTASKKVDKDEVIASINLSPEEAVINANKISLKGKKIDLTSDSITIASNNFNVDSEGNMTCNNGTFRGTIYSSSGAIGGVNINDAGMYFDNGSTGWGLWGTTFHANIIFHAGANTSNIGGAPFRVLHDGSLYATKAAITGEINATKITCTNGSFAGWNVSSGGLSGDRLSLNTSNGQITVFPASGGGYIISNGLRLSASAGAAISSNSNGSVAAPSKGLDIKGCSGATVYIGCMTNASGSTEASCLSVENGAVNMRGGTFYVNGTPVGSSSSKNMKQNIRTLTRIEKEEMYKTVHAMPFYHYDYKEKYIKGLKDNFGFVLEDIEDTILSRVLHISQDKKDKNIKYYSDGDLGRLELILIQMIQEKIENLEKKVGVN